MNPYNHLQKLPNELHSIISKCMMPPVLYQLINEGGSYDRYFCMYLDTYSTLDLAMLAYLQHYGTNKRIFNKYHEGVWIHNPSTEDTNSFRYTEHCCARTLRIEELVINENYLNKKEKHFYKLEGNALVNYRMDLLDNNHYMNTQPIKGWIWDSPQYFTTFDFGQFDF